MCVLYIKRVFETACNTQQRRYEESEGQIRKKIVINPFTPHPHKLFISRLLIDRREKMGEDEHVMNELRRDKITNNVK